MGVDLFFRTADQHDSGTDEALRVKRYQRGDVVVWKPSPWVWGSVELTHPEHRIIRFNNMTGSEAEALVSRELDPGRTKTNTWKRVRKLDLDSLLIGSGAFKDFLDDDTRAVPIFDFKGNIKLIDDITAVKPNADTVVP